MGLAVRFLPHLEFRRKRQTYQRSTGRAQLPMGGKDSWRVCKSRVRGVSGERRCVGLGLSWQFILVRVRNGCGGVYSTVRSSGSVGCEQHLTLLGYTPQFAVAAPIGLWGGPGATRIFREGGVFMESNTSTATAFTLQHRYLLWLRDISLALFYYVFIKIKYKGKSYKWHKKRTSLILRFGYSHLVSLRLPDAIGAKRVGKMKLIFFGTSGYELRSFLTSAVAWRPMNIYNGRGLRFARQLVFRKAGKVSAYR